MRATLVISSIFACCLAAASQDFQTRQQHVDAAAAALRAEQAEEGRHCAAQNQYEDNICSAQSAEAADRNLAVFYQNLKAILAGEAQHTLQASQDAWLDYRKKTCDAVFAFYRDGTIRNAAQARCHTRLTSERMRDLDYLYEGPLHH